MMPTAPPLPANSGDAGPNLAESVRRLDENVATLVTWVKVLTVLTGLLVLVMVALFL